MARAKIKLEPQQAECMGNYYPLEPECIGGDIQITRKGKVKRGLCPALEECKQLQEAAIAKQDAAEYAMYLTQLTADSVTNDPLLLKKALALACVKCYKVEDACKFINAAKEV